MKILKVQHRHSNRHCPPSKQLSICFMSIESPCQPSSAYMKHQQLLQPLQQSLFNTASNRYVPAVINTSDRWCNVLYHCNYTGALIPWQCSHVTVLAGSIAQVTNSVAKLRQTRGCEARQLPESDLDSCDSILCAWVILVTVSCRMHGQ